MLTCRPSGGRSCADAMPAPTTIAPAPLTSVERVSVAPKSAESDFRVARLGFAHGDLARMILEDKLGQTATVIFAHAVRNGPVAPEEVSFTPPAGADVIGTPVP